MRPELSFWEAETRCGYRVSAEMKQVWGVQLELLAEVQRVCREHGLRYFASGGTLLGAQIIVECFEVQRARSVAGGEHAREHNFTQLTSFHAFYSGGYGGTESVILSPGN